MSATGLSGTTQKGLMSACTPFVKAWKATARTIIPLPLELWARFDILLIQPLRPVPKA
jgi:hypothetical protein